MPPPAAFGAAPKGLLREAVDAKLSRVPVFTVTNAQASPYLTEMDSSGRRSGFLFLSPQDAVKALGDIRGYDPRASLNVLPLDQVWYDISATAAEAAKAPQPTAGTSTDLRLFRLRPLGDETSAAARISGKKLDEGDVPLFYESSLKLEVDGRLQQPCALHVSKLTSEMPSC
jgi:hypothetical protein